METQEPIRSITIALSKKMLKTIRGAMVCTFIMKNKYAQTIEAIEKADYLNKKWQTPTHQEPKNKASFSTPTQAL